MEPATITFVVLGAIFAVLLAGLTIFIFTKLKLRRGFKRLTDMRDTIMIQEKRLEGKETEFHRLSESIKETSIMRDTILENLTHLENQRALAAELAEKELELEAARRKAEHEAKLTKDLNTLTAEHPVTSLTAELQTLNDEIEMARRVVLVQQEQARKTAAEEGFVDFHSLSLTPQDSKDIELIRELTPKLTRTDSISKLIWTEFYQKPLQLLCKTLKVEKVRGIYKITNIKNKRMYIGQAVDIAARWKDHAKTGLGIGSTSYRINKFYKALHDEGIENFTFEIIEIGSDINLNERERYWIEFYNAVDYGYNTKVGG